MSEEILLAGGVRTPIGSFCGALSSVPAPTLGSAVIKAAIRRAALPAEQVEEVIFGNVLGAGLGQNVARQAAIGAGLSPAVGATTVNKVCGSSLKAVMMAAQAIKAGDAEMIVAGGTENMSSAPYLLPKARNGYRMGNGEIVDSMIRDGLWDVYNNVHMGTCGDRCAEKYQFSRQQQDDFAVASFQRAIEAQQKGLFAAEIVPVEVPSRQATVTVDRDEGPSRFNEAEAAQPATGIRQDGNRDGRQRFQHQRRRRGGGGAVGEKGRPVGRQAPGENLGLRHLFPRARVVHAGPHRSHRKIDGTVEIESHGRRPVRDQ